MKKKNWKREVIIFGILMLSLMVNDAMDHPEDFKKGVDAVARTHKDFKQ